MNAWRFPTWQLLNSDQVDCLSSAQERQGAGGHWSGTHSSTITLQFLHNQRHRRHNNQAKWSITLRSAQRSGRKVSSGSGIPQASPSRGGTAIEQEAAASSNWAAEMLCNKEHSLPHEPESRSVLADRHGHGARRPGNSNQFLLFLQTLAASEGRCGKQNSRRPDLCFRRQRNLSRRRKNKWHAWGDCRQVSPAPAA